MKSSQILQCLRQTLHGRREVRKKGPLASLVMFWRPCAHIHFSLTVMKLFCLMVLELDHTEVLETVHYSMEKVSGNFGLSENL